MAAEIEFDDKEVRAFLSNLKGNLKNIKDGERKYIGLLSSIIYRDIMNHFATEQGSDGPWEHWSFWYSLQMERMGKSGNKILQDTGRLRQNFKPMGNVRTTSEGILWFNDAVTKSGFPYAFAHNEGGDQLPKRDFMWLSNKAQEDISLQTLQFMIDEGI